MKHRIKEMYRHAFQALRDDGRRTRFIWNFINAIAIVPLTSGGLVLYYREYDRASAYFMVALLLFIWAFRIRCDCPYEQYESFCRHMRYAELYEIHTTALKNECNHDCQQTPHKTACSTAASQHCCNEKLG